MAWLIVSEDCISEEGVAGRVLIVSDKAVSSLSVSGIKLPMQNFDLPDSSLPLPFGRKSIEKRVSGRKTEL